MGNPPLSDWAVHEETHHLRTYGCLTNPGFNSVKRESGQLLGGSAAVSRATLSSDHVEDDPHSSPHKILITSDIFRHRDFFYYF